MKKLTKTLGVLALTMVLGFADPVFAQSKGNADVRSERMDNNNDDDTGKWGLAGLLGLLGLLGLKRRDTEVNRTQSTTHR